VILSRPPQRLSIEKHPCPPRFLGQGTCRASASRWAVAGATARGRHASPRVVGPARGLGSRVLYLPGEAGFGTRAGPLGLPIAPV